MEQSETADWSAHVGQELRKTYHRYQTDGFFEKYFAGPDVLDIGYKGYVADAVPVFPTAIGVDLDYPGYDGRTLPFADESQDTVFASHALEHIPDYRQALRDWFRVLRIGGHMVIAVPHQYLYERKLSPPSRFNEDHRRFYTAATLMGEIEESLDPMSYRLRLLEDNDEHFDYTLPPEHHAGGCYELVMAVQRIRRPDYADAVLEPNSTQWQHNGRYPVIVNHATYEPLMTINPGPAPRRILILKLDHRGDFITAFPAFRALRQRFPDAHITIACGPWTEEEARQLGLFDAVIPVAFFPEVSGNTYNEAYIAAGTVRFAKAVAGLSFDLAVDLRVDRDTRMLLAEVDARQRAGFGTIQEFPFLDLFLPYNNPTLENRAHHKLVMADGFGNKIGRHDGFSIIQENPEEKRAAGDVLVFGPWLTFEAGSWRIEVGIEPLQDDFDLDYDVCSDSGAMIHQVGKLEVRRGKKTSFALELSETIERLEVRLRMASTPPITSRPPPRATWHFPGTAAKKQTLEPGKFFCPPFLFRGIKADKKGVYPSLHQQEMQFLLASLIGLRMQNPFVDSEFQA